VLPAGEYAWVVGALSDAATPDAVRAVFERQRLGQWEDEPLETEPDTVSEPPATSPATDPPAERAAPVAEGTPTADPLAALASALVDRLSVVTTAAAIEQGRELRALVMQAIGDL
jgi:hypothetical protein